MKRQHLQASLLLLPVGLVVLSVYAATVFDVSIPLTSQEKTVSRFRPGASATEFEIRERKRLAYSPLIKGPFKVMKKTPRPSSGTTHARGKAEETYRVSGIFITEEDKRAVISNQFVKEGTALNGKRVERIERDKVSLKENGERSWLILESQ